MTKAEMLNLVCLLTILGDEVQHAPSYLQEKYTRARKSQIMGDLDSKNIQKVKNWLRKWEDSDESILECMQEYNGMPANEFHEKYRLK